jgi:hypothetical protein
MIGIAIASAPTVPQKGAGKANWRGSKTSCTYIEKIHEKLNAQLEFTLPVCSRSIPG